MYDDLSLRHMNGLKIKSFNPTVDALKLEHCMIVTIAEEHI